MSSVKRDELKFRLTYFRFEIGDVEKCNAVSPPGENSAQRSEGIDVAGDGRTDNAEARHLQRGKSWGL
jgi:hypothetical protein